MPYMSARGLPTLDGMRPSRTDAALAIGTAVVVSAAALAGVSTQRTPGPGAFVFAAGFGALLLLRRRRPVAVLLASCVVLLGYYALGFPPVGMAVPMGPALFSAAEAGRVRWAVGPSARRRQARLWAARPAAQRAP